MAYTGTASDAKDGTLSGSAFTWRVDFHHAEEILPVMELMDAIYRSAEQGKEVRLG